MGRTQDRRALRRSSWPLPPLDAPCQRGCRIVASLSLFSSPINLHFAARGGQARQIGPCIRSIASHKLAHQVRCAPPVAAAGAGFPRNARSRHPGTPRFILSSTPSMSRNLSALAVAPTDDAPSWIRSGRPPGWNDADGRGGKTGGLSLSSAVAAANLFRNPVTSGFRILR